MRRRLRRERLCKGRALEGGAGSARGGYRSRRRAACAATRHYVRRPSPSCGDSAGAGPPPPCPRLDPAAWLPGPADLHPSDAGATSCFLAGGLGSALRPILQMEKLMHGAEMHRSRSPSVRTQICQNRQPELLRSKRIYESLGVYS